MPILTGRRLERARASRQFHNGRFRNTFPLGPTMQGNSLAIMSDFFFGGKKRMPRRPLPVHSPLATWANPVQSGLRITWLGHSALLIECDGVRVLVDPMFAEFASPVSFAGRRRFHPVPASLAEMLPLDAILLSHDHYDHLSSSTMREIAKLSVPIITSLGVGARLEGFGVAPALITELDWWEEHTLPGGRMSFTATPAQHFSGRGLKDRNLTLWSSWVLTTPKRKIFFSGDTGLNDELALIGEKLGPFDLTMLEIGASNPAWADIHLGPEGAVRAFEMLGGGTLMPVHWGTFDLALHRWDEPAETLLNLAEQKGIRLFTPSIGKPTEPLHVEGATPWWRTAG